MKVTVTHKEAPKKVNLRLEPGTRAQLDALATQHGVSLQALIEAILTQALADKTFSVTIHKSPRE